MTTAKQVIEAVYERDIDLLLIEEFLSDLTFTHHFLSGTNIPIPVLPMILGRQTSELNIFPKKDPFVF